MGRGAFLIQKISWLGTLLSTKSSSRVDTRSHQLHLKSFCCLWPWMLQKDNWHWIFCAAPFVFFWNKLRSFVFLIYSHNPETHGSNKGKTSTQKKNILIDTIKSECLRLSFYDYEFWKLAYLRMMARLTIFDDTSQRLDMNNSDCDDQHRIQSWYRIPTMNMSIIIGERGIGLGWS